MYRESLQKLGLSDKEALVYLTLLRLGPSAASTLARTTRIKRTSIYDILNSLLEKDLITSFKQGRFTYFVVDDVNKLYLHEKQKMNLAKDLVVKFKNKDNLQSGIQVNYYKGAEGYWEIYQDILRTEPKEVMAWVDLDNFYKGLDEKHEKQWTKERVQKNIYGRLLAQDSKTAIALQKEDKKLCRETRLLKNMPFKASCHLYQDNIVFHDPNDDLMAIRIYSPNIYQMMKQIFEVNWNFFNQD